MEPVELVQMNIYQSNTYRRDLSWLHFNDEPRVHEMQQMKDQQSCISVFVAYLTIPILGVLLDEHFHWNKHISQVKMKPCYRYSQQTKI